MTMQNFPRILMKLFPSNWPGILNETWQHWWYNQVARYWVTPEPPHPHPPPPPPPPLECSVPVRAKDDAIVAAVSFGTPPSPPQYLVYFLVHEKTKDPRQRRKRMPPLLTLSASWCCEGDERWAVGWARGAGSRRTTPICRSTATTTAISPTAIMANTLSMQISLM